MATMIQDAKEWGNLTMDTLFNATCVKTIPNRFAADARFKERQRTGRLHTPSLQIGEVDNDAALHDAADGVNEVVVIAHPTEFHPEDVHFIWRGTPAEFRDNWIGD